MFVMDGSLSDNVETVYCLCPVLSIQLLNSSLQGQMAA